MTRFSFSITEEPTTPTYQRIIDYAERRCDQFLLVRRASLPLAASGLDLLERLRPFLLRLTRESAWPGTTLYRETAQVHRYGLTHVSAAILRTAASGLFAWQQPDLPEDLSLLRSDGEPWLVTISHEHDAFFHLTNHEHAELVAEIPGLALRMDGP